MKRIRLDSSIGPVYWIILITGCILRFYNYPFWSLSNDELSALARLNFSSLAEVFHAGVKELDMHPPGVQLFLYGWTALGGDSEFWLRLPFVMAGCLFLPVYYRLASRWIGKGAALSAMAMVAGLSFPVLYSQLARPYSPGLLFCTLHALFLSRWIPGNGGEDSGERKTLLGLTLSGSAAMYTHYFAFLFMLITMAWAFLVVRKRQRYLLMLAIGLMSLLYLPAWPVFFHHFGIGGLGGDSGWLQVPQWYAIFSYIYYTFNSDFIVLFVCLLVFILTYRANGISQRGFGALLLFFSLILIAFLYSVFRNPVFQYSILIFSFPFLFLFLFDPLRKAFAESRYISIALLLLLLSVTSTVFSVNLYTQYPFADFKRSIELAQQKVKDRSKENSIFIANVIHPSYANYYLKRIEDPVQPIMYSLSSQYDYFQLNEKLKTTSAGNLIYSWANNYHSAEFWLISRRYFPFVVEKDSFFNSATILLSRSPAGIRSGQPETLFLSVNDSIIPIQSSKRKIDLKYIKSNSIHSIDSLTEFGPTTRLTAGECSLMNKHTIAVELDVNSILKLKEAKIVLSIDRGEEQIFWRAADFSAFQIPGVFFPVVLAWTFTDQKIQPNDRISVYVWNPAKENFSYRSLRVEVLRNLP